MLAGPGSRTLAIIAAYAGAALLTAVLPRDHGILAWYPPTAVGVAILVTCGLRWWPLVAVLEVLTTLVAVTPPPAAVALAVPALAQIPLAAWLLRQLRLRFLAGEDALAFALVAIATAGVGAALAGGLEAWLGGVGVAPGTLLLAWWLANVASLTTILPVALLASRRTDDTWPIPGAHARAEVAIILAAAVGTVAASAIAFPWLPAASGALRILWVLPIAWMAVRYGRLLAAIVAGLIAAVGVLLFTLPGLEATRLDIQGLQVTLIVTSTLGLLVSSALAGRREAVAGLERASSALGESRRRYEQVFTNGAAIQFIIEPETMRFLDASETAAAFYGFSPERMRTMALPDIDPAPVEVIRERIARTRGERAVLYLEHRRADGAIRTMEVLVGPILIDDRDLLHAIARDVTEERAARMEVARLAAAVESSAEAVVTTDLDGTITGWNPAAEELYGHPRRAAIGRRVDDLLGPLEVPADELAALTREGRSIRLGFVLRTTARGIAIPVALTISPIVADGGVVGISQISHDLRLLLREQERLRRSEALLADAAEIGRIGSWEVEPRTGGAVWSDELYRIAGMQPGEPVTSSTLLELVHPDDATRVAAALAGPGGAPVAFRLVGRDGPERAVVASWSRVREGAAEAGRVVGVLRDVTDERVMEEQLRQAQRLESVGLLASGVAHDFNNLLTAIAGFADLARSDADDGVSPADDLAQVEAAVERGRALTSQLLAFARRSVARPRPVDLATAVTGLVPMLRRLLGGDIGILTELEPDAVALVDPGQLDQVLVNLAVNARDAMPAGGQLRLAAGRVERAQDGEPAPPRVWLEVEDGGSGVPAHLLGRIFEPFFTTKERGQGTGLGLATVQGIVVSAGGSIEVRSEVGRGSLFRVELPAVDAVRWVEAAPRRPEAASGEGLVLLVEDEELVRRVAHRVLARAGFEVLTAANVPDALEIAARRRPDALVTDIVLPGIGDGISLAEELHARWPDLPTLFVTGYTERVPPSWAGLLTKPYESAELVLEVRRLIEAAAAGDRLATR